MGLTSNYALYPADRLLVRTSVRMTLEAPPNVSAFSSRGAAALAPRFHTMFLRRD